MRALHASSALAEANGWRSWLGWLVLAGAVVAVALAPALPAGASNHLSPAPDGQASLDWLNDAPLADLDQAAANGELTLAVTAGSSAPVVTNVAFGDFEVVDADGNGDDDLEARLTVDTSASPPRARLNVNKITQSQGTNPTDVEVLAFVPWGEFTEEPADERHHLVVGFRTAARSNSGFTTGGELPTQEIIGFQMDPVSGRDHELTMQFVTEGPTNPLRLLTGHFDGTDSAGVVAADLVSTLPHDPLGHVSATLDVDASELGTEPEQGEASLDWTASAPVPVTFDYLEAERTPGRVPDVDTHVLAEEMPDDTSLTLTLQEDGGDTDRPAVLTWSANHPMTLLEVRHRRHNPDGPTRVDGRLTNLEPEVELAVHDDGSVRLTLPGGGRVGFTLEAALADLGGAPDGRAWFGAGALSHELDHLVARVDDTPELTVVPRLGGDTGFELQLPTGGLPSPDVRFLATDDLSAPVLPDRWGEGSPTVSGHPRTWPSPSQRPAEIGVVDDETRGSSVAARFGALAAVTVTTNADTLGEAVTVTAGQAQDLRVDTRLTAGTPMADGARVEARCDLELPAGTSQVDVRQPDHFGWTLPQAMPHLRCEGERGDGVEYALEADQVPANTTVEAPDFGDGSEGRLAVSARDATESPVGTAIGGLELRVRDEVDGLTASDELLGHPVHFAVVRAEGLPSSDVEWSTAGGQTSVDVTARTDDAPENRIGVLDFRLRTDEPASGEALSETPTPTLGGTRHFQTHYLQAVEEGTSVWLGGGVRATETLHAEVTDDGTATSLSGAFAAQHPAAVDLRTTDGGPFTDGWSLDLLCAVGPVSVRVDELTLAPPEQRLSLAAPDAFGDLACHAPRGDSGDPGRVQRASDGLDASFAASGGGLPGQVSVDLDPGSEVTLDTGTRDLGFLRLGLEDRSGAGLPAAEQLFQQPLGAASVRLDDAASSTVSWSTDGDTRVAAVPARSGGKVGTVQADLRTDDSAAALGDVTAGEPHRLALEETTGDSYSAALTARLVQVGESTVDVGDGLHADLNTVADRMLEADVDTDPGGVVLPANDVDALLQLENVPGSLTYHTDLTGRHDIQASDAVDALRFDGTVDDVHANGVVTSLPTELTLDTEALSVTATGGVGAVDAKLTDDSDADGLFDGVNELRVTAEALPGNLAVDVDGLRADTTLETGPDGQVRVLDGTASITDGEGSSGPIGRLAVTATSTEGDGFFGTPYRHAHLDLEGVPASWTVSYHNDADTGDTEVRVEPDQGSLSSALVQVTRKNGGADAVSDELANFEGQTAGLDRSAYTATIDERHYPQSVRQRLDDVFDDTVAFATDTRPERGDPWPEQGSGEGEPLTVPDQDHAILLEGDDAAKTLSARISDVSAATVGPVSDTGLTASLERSGGAPGPFFLGVRERTRTRHAAPEDPLSAPDPEEGHPQTDDDTVVYTLATSGSVPFVVLRNDDPASDADGDALDPATLRVVEGPEHGSATVDGRRVAYEPDGGHHGRDQLRYEICDQGGDCSQAVLTVITAERYSNATVASLADLPDELAVSVDGTEVERDGTTVWEPREISYQADASLGRLDVYQGPLGETRVADPQRLRGVAYDGPAEVDATLKGAGLFGIDTFDVDTSGVTDLVFAVQQADQRSIVGLRGEDLRVDTPISGALNGDRFAFEAKTGHPHSLPNVDNTDGCQLNHPLSPCAQLAFVGLELRAQGDATGEASSGFVTLSERRGNLRALSPAGPDPGAREWVPSLTGRFQGVQAVQAGAELQLRPFYPTLLKFKPGASLGATSRPAVDVDLWWNDDEACFRVPPNARDTASTALGPNNRLRVPSSPGHLSQYEVTFDSDASRLCITFRTPDYVDNTPIQFGLPVPFDPYGGELPDPVNRLGSGIATLDTPFISPGQRFFVLPLASELSRFGDVASRFGGTGAARLSASAAGGEIAVTELPADEVAAPLPGETLAAVRLEGADGTLPTSAEVVFDLDHYAPEGQPVCAANRLADGGLGAVSCMNLDHDEAVERGTGNLARVLVDRPGSVVLVGSSRPETACADAFVPPAAFDDIAGSVHEAAIECVAWYGITRGMGDIDDDGAPEYAPRNTITRDQMASFVARLATQAGMDPPDDADDAFADDDGSVHEDNINALAALGIVRGKGDVDGDGQAEYGPREPVFRDQMASFLARLHQRLTDEVLDDVDNAFADDDGSVHEDNINVLAALDVTEGRGDLDDDGQADYAPREPVFRDQMASFLARELDELVEAGVAHPGDTQVLLESRQEE